MKRIIDEEQKKIIEQLELQILSILRVLRKKDLSLSENRIVSEQLSQIRAMLSTSEQLERESKRNPALAKTIQYLQKSFIDLERMAKEARKERSGTDDVVL
jgi:hypothetical protein